MQVLRTSSSIALLLSWTWLEVNRSVHIRRWRFWTRPSSAQLNKRDGGMTRIPRTRDADTSKPTGQPSCYIDTDLTCIVFISLARVANFTGVAILRSST
ncbi:hypothetical protein M441DRAFT_68827 [Trichoderma asperellum CBS 433.97]|uniref:Secreted protein n=1 Tax=Trichoderma asperellum (strain ATCC 204424 / CBS 433.97 / NBRC 101777) TaxID=1042311 RepID=A0A2T3ZAH5_TRIA4|nr:hypothetical protein M441DRAFT_68827 [Trichoderma asperellum CBS 433.97]PTB41818.1 hypothetical protein M441DRAFT_68827 [Trichoderma asperellum CBS 433.97]